MPVSTGQPSDPNPYSPKPKVFSDQYRPTLGSGPDAPSASARGQAHVLPRPGILGPRASHSSKFCHPSPVLSRAPGLYVPAAISRMTQDSESPASSPLRPRSSFPPSSFHRTQESGSSALLSSLRDPDSTWLSDNLTGTSRCWRNVLERPSHSTPP